MLRFDIITLFPDIIAKHLEYLPFKKALSEKLIEVNIVNLRDFAIDKHGTVDDKPFGGGSGMILMIEPISKALEHIKSKTPNIKNRKIVVLSPRGKTYNQQNAKEFLGVEQMILICGRYEGIDGRVEENFATDVISIGNYVLSGGEIPALAVMESVTRLIPGVIEKDDVTSNESFEKNNIEYPQYTRPSDFNGLKVPEVLLNGNHKEIENWKLKHTKKVK